MKILTSAFQPGKPIPQKYTCQGENVSPELSFDEIPANAKSLVLIMDDPDAPGGTFDHWIGWNIPPKTRQLKEGAKLPHKGKNSYNVLEYKGPCPPPGKAHRYYFKLYALDAELSLSEGSSKGDVEQAMEGHIIAKAELVGLYQRS